MKKLRSISIAAVGCIVPPVVWKGVQLANGLLRTDQVDPEDDNVDCQGELLDRSAPDSPSLACPNCHEQLLRIDAGDFYAGDNPLEGTWIVDLSCPCGYAKAHPMTVAQHTAFVREFEAVTQAMQEAGLVLEEAEEAELAERPAKSSLDNDAT